MVQLTLSVTPMRCRHCVRHVTRRLRDVSGVETVLADAATGTVVLAGRMHVGDVLAAFAGSEYTIEVTQEPVHGGAVSSS